MKPMSMRSHPQGEHLAPSRPEQTALIRCLVSSMDRLCAPIRLKKVRLTSTYGKYIKSVLPRQGVNVLLCFSVNNAAIILVLDGVGEVKRAPALLTVLVT